MSKRGVGVLLILGLLAISGQAQDVLPVQERGGMTAQLVLQVREQASTPGLAEVVATVTVVGPLGMEVGPVEVADPIDAWKFDSSRSCRWEGDRLLLTEVLNLKQVKPGQQALPSLKVRFQASPDLPKEDAEWTDLLKPRDVLPPELTADLPGTTSPAWLWPAIAGGSGMVVVLALLVAARLLRRPKPLPPPTPEQWALAELTRLEGQGGLQGSEWYHTRLSYVVRRFLEEKYGLKAPRQTTVEFLSSAREAEQLSDSQRELLRQLLERCDLAKFAPVKVSPEDCRQTTELARSLVSEGGHVG